MANEPKRHRAPVIVIAAVLLHGILLSVSPAQAVDVLLAWDPSPSPQVTGYLLYYGTASGQYSESVDTGQATTAALSGLQATVTYYCAVLAYDASGNHSPFSNEVQYTAQDTLPPSLAITAPGDGTMVATSSLVTISATATDNISVSTVVFYVNGNRKCSTTTSPYTCAWKVSGATGKTYRLKATATDAQGNVGVSSIVRVTSQ
jgi:Bacterial Ig domain/Fibronectin type III domain